MDKLLTAHQVAEILGCHEQTIYRNPHIPRVKLPGGAVRYKSSDIEKYIDNSVINNNIHSITKLAQLYEYNGFNLTLPPSKHIFKSGGNSGMAKAKSKARYNFGYGAIYQRKTKNGKIRWYLDYRDSNGKRIQKVAPLATTKEEAVLVLRDEIAKMFSKEYGIEQKKKKITFREFAQIYYSDYLTVERKNWKSDGYRLNKLNEHFKELEFKEITSQEVRRFKKARIAEGNSERTVNRYLALLKRMFNIAIQDGYAKENPVKRVKFFSEKDTQRERVLTKDEEERLLTECPGHLKQVILTALHTGMRKGEILNLKWIKVNLEKKEIVVERTKSRKTRTIPINLVLHELMASMKKQSGGRDYVFPFKSIRTAFENACKRAGIKDLTFHDLRRTFGTRLLESGIDIVTIQRLYGHSNPLVTQMYLHPQDELSKEAVECLVPNRLKMTKNGEDLLHNRDTEKTVNKGLPLNHSFSVN